MQWLKEINIDTNYFSRKIFNRPIKLAVHFDFKLRKIAIL
jgi:hypothetical protein